MASVTDTFWLSLEQLWPMMQDDKYRQGRMSEKDYKAWLLEEHARLREEQCSTGSRKGNQ